MHPDLKNRHPDRIDVRVLGGKMFFKPAGELEHIGVQQFRRHPPNRALLFADSGPVRRFIDNRGKPKVPQACVALGIYQDVDLAVSISIVSNCTLRREHTPLRSPWTILWSCKYFNPVTAPASYRNDQCTRVTSLPLHSQVSLDYNPDSS